MKGFGSFGMNAKEAHVIMDSVGRFTKDFITLQSLVNFIFTTLCSIRMVKNHFRKQLFSARWNFHQAL